MAISRAPPCRASGDSRRSGTDIAFLRGRTRLVDDEERPERHGRWQLLDDEPQSFRGGFESHVSGAAPARPAAARKKLGLCVVVESVQVLRLPAGLLTDTPVHFCSMRHGMLRFGAAARVRATVLMMRRRGARRCQAISMVPTAGLPLRGSFSVSNFTFWPSRSARMPARSSAVAWTNTSFSPSSGAMKPKPL